MEQGLKHTAPAGARQKQVIEHRMALKHRRLLELAPDAQIGDLGLVQLGQINLAFKKYITGIRSGFAGDDIHHRGLAGPVRADDGAQFTRFDIE